MSLEIPRKIVRYERRDERYNTAMLRALHLHPDSVCTAVQGIYVQLERRARDIVIDYVIRGSMAELQIPQLSPPRTADELWRHTCCEAFLVKQDDDVYYELNFSPSSEWAAYRFDAYRTGMKVVATIAPSIEIHRRDDELQILAFVELGGTELEAKTLRVGLSAVIEERIGRTSYWALAHAPGKPDFHRAESFAIEFPAN